MGPTRGGEVLGRGRAGRRGGVLSDVPSWSVGGKWLFGLELRESSAQDTNLEVIMLAGDSSTHAGPSVGLQPGQASLRNLVRSVSPARESGEQP